MLIGVRGRGGRATGARRGEPTGLLSVRARPEPAGALIGLEHEFRVLAGGEQVDFRELIHTLRIDGQRLDPGDTNAYRCRSGISITADGDEAEFATPPVVVRPGVAAELTAWAERGRAEIERALPPGHVLEGFSTHLSITMDDEINERVYRLFAEAFAAPFAMLIEGPLSQGIYVRPRPGRIELCGEFATGAPLEAAAVFGIGAVLACVDAVVRGDIASLPPRLRVTTLPGVERYGIRVRRDAYGVDLYAAGRGALLTTVEGSRVTAQAHFEAAWRSARSALTSCVSAGELHAVDAIVRGRGSLAVDGASIFRTQPRDGGAPLFARSMRRGNAFGRVVSRIERPNFAVTPILLTWELAVFRLEGVREAYAAIPRSALAEFEERLARGKLDQALESFLKGAPAGRTLQTRAQVAEPALFDSVGDRAAMVAPERDPEGTFDVPSTQPRAGKQVLSPSPSPSSARAGKLASRRWKVLPLPAPRAARTEGPHPPSEPTPAQVSPIPPLAPPRTWVAAVVVGAVGILAVAGAIGAFAVTRGSDAGGNGGAVATPTHDAGAAAATPTRAATEVGTSAPTVSTALATETTTADPTAAAAVATATDSPPTARSETPAGATATGTAANDATPTPTPTATTRPTETPRPTATFTPTPTPTPTATPTIIIIALPPPPAPTAVPTAVPSPACTPSATKNCP